MSRTCKVVCAVAALVVMVTFIASSALAAGPTLVPGSKAPALKVARWVKGTSVKGFRKGRVYVVEVWATWCGPCKDSIPHLTKLARKYKVKVALLGISVDRTDKDPRVVDKFVKEMGDKMDYGVAIDGPEETMTNNWLVPARARGIPTAFVIGKDGRIAWIGHPMDGLDKVLPQILAGKFDVQAEAKREAKAHEAEWKEEDLWKPYNDARRANEYPKLLAEANKMIAANPANEDRVYYGKLTALLKTDEPAGYAYARRLFEGAFKDNWPELNVVSQVLLDQTDLKSPDYQLMMAIASRVNDLAKDDWLARLNLSKAQFKCGQKDKAIETGNEAVELAERERSRQEESAKTPPPSTGGTCVWQIVVDDEVIKGVKDTVAGYK